MASGEVSATRGPFGFVALFGLLARFPGWGWPAVPPPASGIEGRGIGPALRPAGPLLGELVAAVVAIAPVAGKGRTCAHLLWYGVRCLGVLSSPVH